MAINGIQPWNLNFWFWDSESASKLIEKLFLDCNRILNLKFILQKPILCRFKVKWRADERGHYTSLVISTENIILVMIKWCDFYEQNW